jgi:hypothetical protein
VKSSNLSGICEQTRCFPGSHPRAHTGGEPCSIGHSAQWSASRRAFSVDVSARRSERSVGSWCTAPSIRVLEPQAVPGDKRPTQVCRREGWDEAVEHGAADFEIVSDSRGFRGTDQGHFVLVRIKSSSLIRAINSISSYHITRLTLVKKFNRLHRFTLNESDSICPFERYQKQHWQSRLFEPPGRSPSSRSPRPGTITGMA